MSGKGHPSPIRATHGECEKQKDAFSKLCCPRTASLAVRLGSPEGRDALQCLNAATADSFNKLQRLNTYCVNYTLGQGACLLVAVLQELDLLDTCWCGPAAELSKHAIHVMHNFQKTKKVGFLYARV